MNEKKMEIMKLVTEVNDEFVWRFMDTDSDKYLDEKLEVLTALKRGIPPADIPKYNMVLELMPNNSDCWD